VKRIIGATIASAIAALGVGLIVGGSESPVRASGNLLNGPSQSVGLHVYFTHPGMAPPALRRQAAATARRLRAAAAQQESAGQHGRAPGLFNRDTVGLPQNEESVTSCASKPRVVLGGTNDFRFLVDPQGNSTGWHFSDDGGRSVTNEGLLPALTASDGTLMPSGGDPVNVASPNCEDLYAADLNYSTSGTGPLPFPSGIGLYRTTPQTLATCPQGESNGGLTHPECWPTHRLVDEAAPGHFLDKEWMDVGRSGTAGNVVWIAWGDLSDFNAEGNEESGVIKAARCTPDLSSCTDPIVLSAGQTVAEYPDVTIGPDGRTYITWGEFFGGSFIGPSQQAWIAVAEPGSTTFKRYPVYREDQVLRARETLHANDFRIGTMFKNDVVMVDGKPRVLVTWERCQFHASDQVCEEPEIPITYSDDLGTTWSPQRILSAGGDNYMPEIDSDPGTGALYASWYTHRFDPLFHNRQDVELVRLSPAGGVMSRERVTKTSNATEADPVLHGNFIGDYFEINVNGDRVYVHYNANTRQVPFLGEGPPLPQQDNFLAVRRAAQNNEGDAVAAARRR
jgi:hypothetical protein